MTAPATSSAATAVFHDTRTVTAEEIGRHRAAVRSMIGAAHEPDPAVQASPVYPFVLASGASDRIIGELIGATDERPALVHLTQEILVHRPVRPGELIPLGARREPRGVRLALRCELSAGEDTPVATLVTGALLVGADTPEPFGEFPASAAPSPAGEQAEPIHVTHRLTTETIRRYAEASGDHNPIHLDADAARAAGFPGVIAHGMSVVALACEEVIDRYAAGDATRIRGVGVRFSAPVLPGEPVDLTMRPDRNMVGFAVRTPRGPALKNGWVTFFEERNPHG